MLTTRVGLTCAMARPLRAAGDRECLLQGLGVDAGLRWPAASLWPRVHARRAGGCLHTARLVALQAAGPPGGGVLDRPTVSVPGLDIGKDTKKQRPRFYRVMLHNDNFNRREYVVQVLMKVIPGMTVDDAVNVMQEAHVNGLACVIACAQQEAEEYCERLRTNGLMVTLEPAGGGGKGSPDAC